MNQLATSDIIAIISGLVALLTAAFTVFKSVKEARKTKAETEKISGADTTETYAKAANLTAEQNLKLYERLNGLDDKVQELFNTCLVKDREISELKDKVDDLTKIINKKDERIVELEKLSEQQESRILELENEIYTLKFNQGFSNKI
jgi:predicted RNase H-like nuclease (RuvC/YqgF family)